MTDDTTLSVRSSVASFAHWLKRNILVIAIVSVCVSLAVTYGIIDDDSADFGMKPKRIIRLLTVNVVLFSFVISIIIVRIYWLWKTLKSGSANYKLQKRIVAMFSLVTIIPTLIVSIFSAIFFNIGIQTWFNERVQRTVQESKAVAEAYLVEHKENIRADAIAMAGDLDKIASLVISNPQSFDRAVSTQAALRELTEAIVVQRNKIIAQSRFSFSLSFETIPQDALEKAERGEVVILAFDYDKVQALIKIPSLRYGYLLVGRLIDSKVIEHMRNTQGAVNEYESLKKQLNRFSMTFSIVFVTMALLLLLSSAWYGMVFATRLTRPIRKLVQAAERVRGGDFSARISGEIGNDELGTLSRSFNRMTEQLDAQRKDLIEANRSVDERRIFIETVLSGVSAGVIALDREKIITLHNRSSESIFSMVGKYIVNGEHIVNLFPEMEELLLAAEDKPMDIAEGTITINSDKKSLSLHVRVTVEHIEGNIKGFIITFDDITPLIAAQRSAAWADVARRVAHEIKNPLTPIQLSAERIKRKYLKFVEEDKDSFIKYTDTITKHVADIGKMVEEFVSFAKMPTASFSKEDIITIIKKAVFSAKVVCPNYDFQLSFSAEHIFMNCDERQMTQVMTNLLKNAVEAIDDNVNGDEWSSENGVVKVGADYNDGVISITVEDNGIGLQENSPEKLLEPYVTTRKKGTGLGLSIVKKIVEDHNGLIKIENIKPNGVKVTLSFLQHCDIKDAK
ncbi:MAG: PAS domain-containing sensor histidine kinase [Rickettsiales bacterium]